MKGRDEEEKEEEQGVGGEEKGQIAYAMFKYLDRQMGWWWFRRQEENDEGEGYVERTHGQDNYTIRKPKGNVKRGKNAELYAKRVGNAANQRVS